MANEGLCRLFSATIAGLAPTSLNPTSAGWTLIPAGTTSDLAQTATKCAIFDNGIVRVILDKNATGDTAFRAYGFNGTAWKLILQSQTGAGADWQTPTISIVQSNTSKKVQVKVTVTNRAAGVCQQVFTILQDIPAFTIQLAGRTGTQSDAALDFASSKTAFIQGTTPYATDIYGYAADVDLTSLNQFMVFPSPSLGFDRLYATSKQEAAGDGLIIFPGLSPAGGIVLVPNDDAVGFKTMAFGIMPRTYAMGDGGGANIGNGDGQLREAEDNYTAGGGASLSVQADVDASGGKGLRFSTPATGHIASLTMNFPSIGVYYILTAVACDTGAITARVNTAGSVGASKTIAATAFSQQAVHLSHGPFTITAAGNYAVEFEILTVGVGTVVVLDHISIFPYEETASTPAGQTFPKNLARLLVRGITPGVA